MSPVPGDYRIIFITLLSVLITSCNSDINTRKTTEQPIQIKRFEQDLFSIGVYDLEDSLDFLKQKYPRFLPLFSYKIIEIGNPDNPAYSDRLLTFVTDFTIHRVNQKCQRVFPNLDRIESELSGAFEKYNVFFPEKSTPAIFSCISGFNQSIIISDSLLAISLDKYLGRDDEFYKLMHPPIPNYLRYVMHPEKIPSDAMYAWITSEFEYHNKKNNLLSQMIYEGRALYCTQQTMPHIADSLLWGYNDSQIRFCENNEKSMWLYLIENKLLFTTDHFTINQMINEAPFTKQFSRDSPGKAAVWIGYRIVKSYMKKNKNKTIRGLMQETDYQKILNLSKYNP